MGQTQWEQVCKDLYPSKKTAWIILLVCCLCWCSSLLMASFAKQQICDIACLPAKEGFSNNKKSCCGKKKL